MVSLFRALRAIAILAPLAAAPLAAQAPAAAQKFGFVKTQTILAGAPGRAEAEAQFQKELPAMQDVAKRMTDSVNNMIADYSKVQATLSQAEKDKRVKAIQDKQAEIDGRRQELEAAASQRQQELVQPIIDNVKLVLEELRVEGGYTAIIDLESQGGGIVAFDKNLDMSDRVLAKLRTMPIPTIAAKAAPGAAKPTSTGAPVSTPAGVKPPVKKPPTL
jgi:outer membrane protein